MFWKKVVFKDYGMGWDEYLMVKWWEMGGGGNNLKVGWQVSMEAKAELV